MRALVMTLSCYGALEIVCVLLLLLLLLLSSKFKFASDVLCVSLGCDVRLVKNINVSAGLVNSTTGTVVAVIYDNADDAKDLSEGS